MVNVNVVKYAVKFAWSDILTRKMRSTLTVLGIAVGVALLIALMSVSLGMRSEIETKLEEYLGVGILVSSNETLLPESISLKILKIPYVRDAYPLILVFGSVEERPAVIIGLPPEKQDEYLTVAEVLEGRELNPGDKGVLLEEKLAKRLNVKVGDKVTVSAGLAGRGKDSYPIVGIVKMESLIGFGEMNVLIMPIKLAQDLLGRPSYASQIQVKVVNRRYVDVVARTIKKLYPHATITTPEEIMRRINRILNIINTALISIASISMIVASLSVMNTIMMVVRERIREIGILKAIGATRGHVLMIFLSEALLLSIMGGLLGAFSGAVGSYLLQELISRLTNVRVPPIFRLDIIGEGMLIALIVGVSSGFYPSWKGASIRPIEALRYE